MNLNSNLNERSKRLADHLAQGAAASRVLVRTLANGARILDCGIETPGSIQAGLSLARVCLAGLGDVTLQQGVVGDLTLPVVQVHSDWPIAACLASQYAGWQISVGKYFAMGSGPMRARAGREALFEKIGQTETGNLAVGVLETRKLPGTEVVDSIADKTGVSASGITLLVAPASSLAGTIQVVARSLETALHKLFELGFDLNQVVSGYGSAPLPPPAANELQAIGRTNDAILYGGRVTLWVESDDELLAEIGKRVPASASPDYGAPFAQIFDNYGGDFYKIDPLLFSPAEVTLCNLKTGRAHSFGWIDAGILRRSMF
jgi:methenyltetrahydromethanopterin cyclohydrolase